MTAAGRAAASWLGTSALALAVLVALGALPTQRLAGRDGLVALAAGVAVALAGAALGAAPVVVALARGALARPHVVAGRAMALRAGGSLAGALAVALGTAVERLPFLVWVGVAYLGLLAVETRWMVRWLSPGAPR